MVDRNGVKHAVCKCCSIKYKKSRTIVESVHDKKAELKEYFKRCDSKISATTDLWTPNHLSIMVVTLTWIDPELCVCRYVSE